MDITLTCDCGWCTDQTINTIDDGVQNYCPDCFAELWIETESGKIMATDLPEALFEEV